MCLGMIDRCRTYYITNQKNNVRTVEAANYDYVNLFFNIFSAIQMNINENCIYMKLMKRQRLPLCYVAARRASQLRFWEGG